MGLFRKKKDPIPEEVQVEFTKLQKAGVTLIRQIPVMPMVEPRGFRSALRAMKKIFYLPPGTEIEFLDVEMKRSRPWYQVRKKGTKYIKGWVNSVVLMGQCACLD